jgi:hypothetical protein
MAGFKPAIPASEPPQTHTLDSAATGIGARAPVKVFTHHSLTPLEGRNCRPFHLSLLLQKNRNTFVLYSSGRKIFKVTKFLTEDFIYKISNIDLVRHTTFSAKHPLTSSDEILSAASEKKIRIESRRRCN